VETGGAAIAAGPWFVKYNARGTTIMPTITVSTNVTAPHSRRRTAQFTSAEFYLDLVVVVAGAGLAFLFLLLALVQEADEVLRPREGLPALREKVLDQDLPIRQLIYGDAPLLEGARNLDLEVLLRGLVLDNFVVVESSSSWYSHR
jgi:hypothetical protein